MTTEYTFEFVICDPIAVHVEQVDSIKFRVYRVLKTDPPYLFIGCFEAVGVRLYEVNSVPNVVFANKHAAVWAAVAVYVMGSFHRLMTQATGLPDEH